MKKLLNLVLCLALIVTTVTAFTACSDDDSSSTTKDLGFVYELVDGEDGADDYLKITGYNVSDEVAELVSREDYANEKVKAVSKIVIPSDKVEYKRNGEVVGSYLVKEIAEAAFSNMLFIKEVVIPSNVETVGAGCLAGVANLEKLTVSFVGNKKEDNVNSERTLGYLFGTSEATGTVSATVNYNSTGSITCYVPENLKTVVVTDGAVSDYAFNGMSTVEEVILPAATAKIGKYAFANCTSLWKIDTSKIEKIGAYAFSGCTTLVKADLSSVKVVGESAFSGCTQLFYSVNGSSYKASASVTSIGANAFKGCTALETVDLSALTANAKVGEYAFSGLTSLTSVKLSSSMSQDNYGLLVFTGASKLEKSGVTGYDATLKLFDFDYDL